MIKNQLTLPDITPTLSHMWRAIVSSAPKMIMWMGICWLWMGYPYAAAETFDKAKVWRYTQTHHPLYRRFKKQLHVTKATRKGQQSFPTNPTLSFEGGVQSPSSPTGNSAGAWMPDIEAGFSWGIPIGGRWQKSKQLAKQRYLAAKLVFSLQTLRLYQRVQQSLYDYQRNKKTVEIQNKIAGFHQKMNALIQKREQNGVGNKLNTQMVQIEALRTRQESWQARMQLVTARRKLQQAMGWGQGTLPTFTVGLAPKMGTLPTLQTLLAGIPQHPRMRLAHQQQKIVEAQLKLAKSRGIPDLTLTATYAQSMGAHIIRGGVSMPIPVLWRNQPAVQKYSAALLRQKAHTAYVRLTIRNQLRNAYRRYTLAQRALQHVKTALLPKLQKRSAMFAQGFKEGQLTLIQWLLAQQSLTRGQLSYLQAVKQATNAYFALLWARGGTPSLRAHKAHIKE